MGRQSSEERQVVGPPAAARRPRSAAREEKREAIRSQLIEAASKIIGRYGYAGCTIARVTARAKVAHGTFYLHFKSQQELFDTLLPAQGAAMLEAIGKAIHHVDDLIEIERQGFIANFAYLEKHGYMYRLTSEAELYAPRAYREYTDTLLAAYSKSLRRSLNRPGRPPLTDRQIEVRATMLLGARMHLLTRFAIQNRVIRHLPDDIIETYLAFIAEGIAAPPITEAV